MLNRQSLKVGVVHTHVTPPLEFDMLNQTARSEVLSTAIKKNIGMLGMYAVRRTLNSQANLKTALTTLAEAGVVDENLAEDAQSLSVLSHEKDAIRLTDAAYCFYRHKPGIHTVGCSTGNLEHIQVNVSSLLRLPCPDQDVRTLQTIFKNVDNFSGHG